MYEIIEKWLDDLLQFGIPNNVHGLYFGVYIEKLSLYEYTIKLSGTKNFANHALWTEDIVYEIGSLTNSSFVFEDYNGTMRIYEEIQKCIQRYVESGRYRDVLMSKAGVATGVNKHSFIKIIFKNENYSLPIDKVTLKKKILAFFLMFSFGLFLCFFGLLGTLTKGIEPKVYDGPGDMTINLTDLQFKNEYMVLVIGIFLICLFLCYVVKTKYIPLLFGVGLSSLGLVTPTIIISRTGKITEFETFMYGIGLLGLFLVINSLYKFIAKKDKKEALEKKISNAVFRNSNDN